MSGRHHRKTVIIKGKKSKQSDVDITNNELNTELLHSSHLVEKSFTPRTEREVEDASEQQSPLAYIIVSQEESEMLLQMTANEMESKLEEKFHLDSLTNLKDAAVRDYYVGAAYWCQQQRYNPQQLSIFFTIVHNLLSKIDGERLPLVSLVMELQAFMDGMGTDSTSLDGKFFSSQQAKAIAGYVFSSLFQHHKLYLSMFTTPQNETIITRQLPVDIPLPAGVPYPRSLDEGFPQEMLTRFISQQTLSDHEEPDDDQVQSVETDEIDLPIDVQDSFRKLTLEDVQAIINDTCTSVLNNLQADVEKKMHKQEVASLVKINKVHTVQPSSSDGRS